MAYYSTQPSRYDQSREFGRRFPEPVTLRNGVSRGLFGTVCAIAVAFAAFSGILCGYILFRDEALQALASHQVSTARAYDAQIAALDAEVARLRSMKFVEQERVERQLADVTRLQQTLQARQNALAGLAQFLPSLNDITGSVPAVQPQRNQPAPPPAEPRNLDAKPRPISDVIRIDPMKPGDNALRSRLTPPPFAVPAMDENTPPELLPVLRTLTRMGDEQATALNAIETELDDRLARARRVFADLRAEVPVASATPKARDKSNAAMGGPFVPLTGAYSDPFARQLFRIRTAATNYKLLQTELLKLPVSLPILGDLEVTSSFGPRSDPFFRKLAMHTGVDLRGDTGEPVLAAASGVVTYAGRHTGYGNLVEIDHGNGYVTRYAHLSAILVKEGAIIAAGTPLGRIGSTGRSTAPHLHFEVRINGEPVNPQRYLRAGMRLNGSR